MGGREGKFPCNKLEQDTTEPRIKFLFLSFFNSFFSVCKKSGENYVLPKPQNLSRL